MKRRSRRRLLRLAILLPPLGFIAVFGYWRFLVSDAFRVLVERILGRALRAEVTIGSHEVESLALRRIALEGLSVEFLSEGAPSGVRFEAKEATASASILLGVGPLEEVVVRDAEASFTGPASTVTRLDFFARPKRGAGVGRIRLEGMAVSFTVGERTYRVGGMDWTFDFSGGGLRLRAEIGRLRVDGVRSKGLEEESPSIRFDVEVDGPRVALRNLRVKGRSGWQAEGEMVADLAHAMPEVRGRVDLWDLPVSRIYTPRPGVEISPHAHVERTISFEGPVDRVRVEVTTDVKGLTFADKKLGLRAEGVTLSGLKTVGRFNMVEIVRKLLKGPEREPAEAGDADRDVSNGSPGE